MLSDKKTEGELRKEKSIAFLKKKEVPYIEHLPMIEDSASVKIKAPEVIAKRMVCTLLTIQYAFDIMQGKEEISGLRCWRIMRRLRNSRKKRSTYFPAAHQRKNYVP